MTDKNRVVLAYSGGLDTSVICYWLAQKGCEVICCVVDVGQKEDIDAALEKALASGAKDFVRKDVKEEFVRDGGFQCLRAQAKYGRYLLGTAIARPFIMQKVIEAAHEYGAGAVAHGATGKGNDQVRFKLTVDALDSSLEVIAPWSDPRPEFQEFRNLIPGRKEAVEYAEKHGIPVTATVEKPWSTDRNILHVSHEAGKILEDPYAPPPDELFELVTPPWTMKRSRTLHFTEVDGKIQDARSDNHKDSEELTISFENGYPVAINFIRYDGGVMNPAVMINFLNSYGGKHGIGIVDMIEERTTGMKCRCVYEAPGMTLLYEAHRALAELCLAGDELEDMLKMSIDYGRMVYEGKWFTDRKESMDARVEKWNEKITGKVRLRLCHGGLWVVGRNSPHSLYREQIATMEAGGSYGQSDAHGFMNVAGLPTRVQAERRRKLEGQK